MINRFLKRFQHISDKILVEKAKNGDREAFGKLYLKYLDTIYRYIFFRVNQDIQTAEDLAEVVFFKAWQNIVNFAEQDAFFKAWLYKIAHNVVIDHYRTENKPAVLKEELINENDNVLEDFERKIEIAALMKAINKLSDEQKQIITLKFIEGLSNKEMLQILNKKEEAIRALQYRALKKLKELLS